MILSHIADWAMKTPDNPAIILSDRTLSYREFDALIGAARTAIIAAGPGPHGRVGLHDPDPLRTWLAALALESLGVETIALPPNFDSDPSLLTGVTCIMGPPIAQTPPGIAHRFLDAAPLIRSLTHLEGQEHRAPIESERKHVLLSSGTTGTYKRIAFPKAIRDPRLMRHVTNTNAAPGTRTIMLGFGLWTIHGYLTPLATWYTGRPIVFASDAGVFKTLCEAAPKSILLTPHLARMLIAAKPSGMGLFPNLICRTAGAALSADLFADIHTQLTETIIQVYGATECGIIGKRDVHSAADLGLLDIGAQIEIEIVDEEDNPVPAGQDGIIRIRREHLVSAYEDDPEASAGHFRDGWFYPGDLGRLEGKGVLRLLGRSNDVLNLGGDKKTAASIETIVRQLLNCQDAAVFTREDATGNTLVIAYIGSSPAPQNAVASVNRAFSRACDRVEMHRVDALPRTITGKVQYRKLRDQFPST